MIACEQVLFKAMADAATPPPPPPVTPQPPSRAAQRNIAISSREHVKMSPIYGRFVSAMRVLLPTVATGLILLVLVWPQLDDQQRRFTLGPAKIDKSAAKNLAMLNGRYAGILEEKPFTITAEKALQKNAKDMEFSLLGPKLDIMIENGSWAAITAKDGFYNHKNQILELSGGVNVFHDTGYEFRTKNAVVDMKAGDARGIDPIVGQGPLGNLKAEGFVLFYKTKRIIFTGRSKLTLFPHRMKEG
jgi:lipopolysaccharide export system protein LptC